LFSNQGQRGNTGYAERAVWAKNQTAGGSWVLVYSEDVGAADDVATVAVDLEAAGLTISPGDVIRVGVGYRIVGTYASGEVNDLRVHVNRTHAFGLSAF